MRVLLTHESPPLRVSEPMQTAVITFGNLSNKKGVQPGGERGVALLNHIVWDCLCGLICYLLPSAVEAHFPLYTVIRGVFNSSSARIQCELFVLVFSFSAALLWIVKCTTMMTLPVIHFKIKRIHCDTRSRAVLLPTY